jgi:hypothetical protein
MLTVEVENTVNVESHVIRNKLAKRNIIERDSNKKA